MNAHLLNGSRRSFMVGGVAAMAAVGMSRVGVNATQEDDAADARSRAQLMEILAEYGFLWSATSPATRLDDTATILFTNRRSDPVDIWVKTTIMDHQAHHNELVIDETFTLTAGETRTLTAVNAYGQGNHFSTRMAAGTGDPQELGVEVTVTDVSGTEIASFNKRAFWIKTYAEIQANADARRKERFESDGHKGH
ncbi:hypothetical protein BH23CHL5_BH23CHL5_26180 [soil metagenome]